MAQKRSSDQGGQLFDPVSYVETLFPIDIGGDGDQDVVMNTFGGTSRVVCSSDRARVFTEVFYGSLALGGCAI